MNSNTPRKPSTLGYTSVMTGFTLAELLIALAILGVIATFTIPKILSAQQNQQNNAIAHEVAGMISAAYQAYRQNNQITSSFGIKDLTPYMNYVAVDSSTTIDETYDYGTLNCSIGVCLKLHNGAYIQYWGDTVGGTATTNAVPFHLDPDGRVTDGTTNGPGKAVALWIYTDGRITDQGNLLPNTTYNGGTVVAADPSRTPPWFSW